MPRLSLKLLSLLLASWFLCAQALAQSGSETFGDYEVHYSVFNSTFVQPEVASTYNINRARNRALVNISVMRTESGQTSLGKPANVSGTATNLIQRQQELDFREISDGTATYYIASLRHIDEEMYNFKIQVTPEDGSRGYELTFSRKLYLDR